MNRVYFFITFDIISLFFKEITAVLFESMCILPQCDFDQAVNVDLIYN